MNTIMWVLAGGLLGWIGYAYMGFNEGRSNLISIIIGATGGLVGGKLIAPMFASGPATSDFNMFALFVAAAIAAAFLFVGNLVHERWDI